MVAFPTETVYGLGVAVEDVAAVARVFEVKGRPQFDPLIVHIAHVDQVSRWTTGLTIQAKQLATRFWPGPLTLVLPKSDAVPDLVTAGLPTVAVRIPRPAMALRLIEEARTAIAAPSANLFGQVSPTTTAHVACQLGDAIDYILEGGPCEVGIESTVLDLTTQAPVLLRPGGISREEIESVLGPVSLPPIGKTDGAQVSPGMLERHYAPRTPLRIVTELPPDGVPRTAVMVLAPSPDPERFASVEVLSQTGDLREAAASFYSALRRLDDLGLDQILATPFPEWHLGVALNDRLRRASTP